MERMFFGKKQEMKKYQIWKSNGIMSWMGLLVSLFAAYFGYPLFMLERYGVVPVRMRRNSCVLPSKPLSNGKPIFRLCINSTGSRSRSHLLAVHSFEGLMADGRGAFDIARGNPGGYRKSQEPDGRCSRLLLQLPTSCKRFSGNA
ncbi:MAG: hypothetical protein D6690_02175 [Nitrospirae bacterium]|nr:MAG: hypothetical protein D6690_02175 [Nitrospirota bacterium]